MSWQVPTTPTPTETAPNVDAAAANSLSGTRKLLRVVEETGSPVILRTAQGMVFLGRIRGDYGHAVVLRDSRPIYSWPREGLHHVAAYAGEGDLPGLRLGPAIHEHWLADVRTVWGLTEDGYARLAAREAVSHADTTEAEPDPKPTRPSADPVIEGLSAAAGIANVAAAAFRRGGEAGKAYLERTPR